jgi:phosphoenolpyruvate carboxykinase (GTP)
MPTKNALDTNGLDIKPAALDKLLAVDVNGWLAEIPSIREHFAKFGSHLPKGMSEEVDKLEQRLKAAQS